MSAQSKPELAVMIMAGGAGTRFWPLSTGERPKQFLRLFGERSLLQQSYDRIRELAPDERILVLTNRRLTGLVREQLPELPARNVIGEPERKDTAAAIALGALVMRRRFGDPVMVVLTADQLIRPEEDFRRVLLSAARGAAESSALYTFGVKPSYPATCYGYLERGEPVGTQDGIGHFHLRRFVEKPAAGTAREYLEDGRYYWNSGMFVWRVGTILAELERQLPEHLAQLSPALEGEEGPARETRLGEAFARLKAISIDYGVMEGAREVRMAVADYYWNDVGGWLALEEFLEKDSSGNAARGQLAALDARDNLVYCEQPEETVALIGVSGLVVVRAGDCTLIVPKERAEQIKSLVKRLEQEGRE